MTPSRRLLVAAALLATSWAGCDRKIGPADRSPAPLSLAMGFGLTTGQDAQTGIQQVVRNLALEAPITFARDGRVQPWLLERLTFSPDRLVLNLAMKRNIKLHDGTMLDAKLLASLLNERLPAYLGAVFDDVAAIQASSEYEVQIRLRRPSFIEEGLDFAVEKRGKLPIGTGAFYAVSNSGGQIEMRANPDYHRESPFIQNVQIRPYNSVRSAWADMLRGEIDAVYEVGVDAVDLLQPSSAARVFSYQRSYAYMLLLNTEREALRSGAVRRALNVAIDREGLVRDVLRGHGAPAHGPVWLSHWAHDPHLPKVPYAPQRVESRTPIRFTCLVTDPSHERLALSLQRQFRHIGVQLDLQMLPVDQALARVREGDFDAWLADAVSGPPLIRPYWFWHSSGHLNWSRIRSQPIDAALDMIRHAPDESTYKAGVSAFHRAFMDEPPAIFLAWSERARAVNTRFDVQTEPGRDIVTNLRLWRPAAVEQTAKRN